MTSCTGSTRAEDFRDFEKVRVKLSPASEEDGWLSLARGGLGQVLHEMVGGDEKARIERRCISLLMSKNL